VILRCQSLLRLLDIFNIFSWLRKSLKSGLERREGSSYRFKRFQYLGHGTAVTLCQGRRQVRFEPVKRRIRQIRRIRSARAGRSIRRAASEAANWRLRCAY
jgi:hypothetical protein